MEDLADLPTVRFTQEKDEYLYYSELCRHQRELVDVQWPTVLEWYFGATDAYATDLDF